MKKKVKAKKDFLKGKAELHEKIERKQDRKKLPMPSKKKAMQEAMEGEEVLHEYLEEKLHGKGGSMPKKMYGGKEKNNKHEKKESRKEERAEHKKKPIKKTEKKIKKVMKEYSAGKLHSGSKKGPVVTNPKQALAIGYSEAKRAAKKKRK